MTSVTGTAALVRLILRLDRVRVAIWVVAIPALVLVIASSIKGLYPVAADLEKAAATIADDAAQIALNGPARGLDTLGGRVAFEVWNFGLVGTALMSVFMVGRHTRAEEESGRAEVVRSAVVGVHAPPAAALIVACAMNVLVGAAIALGLIMQDLPARGAISLGASFAAAGFVFAGVAALAAQVTENTRVVYGAGGAALTVAFAVRAFGDVGDGSLSWLSPLGWVQFSQPFVGDRLWPLLLAFGVTAVLVTTTARLNRRRDLGRGLLPSRAGPAVAGRGLAHPIGLSFRLQRGSLIGWSLGMFLGGLALGSVGENVDDLLGDSERARDVFAQVGGPNLTDSFFATFLLILALIASGYALQSALRMRSEEVSLRAEPILATAVSRTRWAGSHLCCAAVGSVVVLAAAGLGAGLAYGVATRDGGEVLRLVGAALAYTPAMWVLVGIAAALFGLAPRATTAAWAGLVACVMIGLLARLLEFPNWLSDLSPFQHVPKLPASQLTVAPLVLLGSVAIGLVAVGLEGFSRRDIG